MSNSDTKTAIEDVNIDDMLSAIIEEPNTDTDTDTDKPAKATKTKTKTKTKIDYAPSSFRYAESLIRAYSLIMSAEPIRIAKETAESEMNKAEKNVIIMTEGGADEEYIDPARKKYKTAKDTFEAKTKELDNARESIKTALATLDEAIKGVETFQSDIDAIIKVLIEERNKATQPAKTDKPAKATKTAKTTKKVSN